MAYTDREDLNVLGQLYLVGETQTPFLNMMGGLAGGGAATSRSFQFPCSQYYSLSSASQNTQSEATAAAAGTPTTYTRSQVYNVAQIMKYDSAVTYAKQSATGEYSGIQVIGNQPVVDELAFQKAAALKQCAVDIEYSFIQGSFTDVSGASTNQKTRGMLEAISTNEVAMSTADITKANIDELVRTMAGNGATFNNMVLFCGAFNMQMISDIYGFAPTDRNVGGVAIKTVITDICTFGVVYDPQIPADDMMLVDMAYVRPVYVPHNGQLISWTDTGITAAQKGGFYYLQIGLDYGYEKFHGKITDSSTS